MDVIKKGGYKMPESPLQKALREATELAKITFDPANVGAINNGYLALMADMQKQEAEEKAMNGTDPVARSRAVLKRWAVNNLLSAAGLPQYGAVSDQAYGACQGWAVISGLNPVEAFRLWGEVIQEEAILS